ncbi:hypothetical protein [Rummeliibacillus sp. TYF-LIM-RU47]|uniref:hypothetical protein n=1 Tax=Rummeliibacillus sp. TYF-LIM-RU47 TaxID=2608406 RepID=UPI00123B78D3|nr:hypothetical protein [Rummeliibacillus sp. TYF-LIM-RU47]
MPEWERISKQMSELLAEKNYPEWNNLVPQFRKAIESHDFGWKAGQEVEYWDMKWKRGKIKEIISNWEIVIEGIIVSAISIRNQVVRQEQMTLF